MNAASNPSSTFYIGWDVGGWNCDNNRESRDSIAVVNSSLDLIGTIWRGNLRDSINRATDASDWLGKLFDLCEARRPAYFAKSVLAIDTPLGYSRQFVKLITELGAVEAVGTSATNEYLFRQTERTLFERGLSPLSAVKDMIGSQSTKGMHVLAKFIGAAQGCGVWSDGQTLTAIEAYPSACRYSPILQDLRSRKQYPAQGNPDQDDALTCALIAQPSTAMLEALVNPATKASSLPVPGRAGCRVS